MQLLRARQVVPPKVPLPLHRPRALLLVPAPVVGGLHVPLPPQDHIINNDADHIIIAITNKYNDKAHIQIINKQQQVNITPQDH